MTKKIYLENLKSALGRSIYHYWTVTNLGIVTVEQFMKLMRFWEMFTQ